MTTALNTIIRFLHSTPEMPKADTIAANKFLPHPGYHRVITYQP
jgi:hypothetical protein